MISGALQTSPDLHSRNLKERKSSPFLLLRDKEGGGEHAHARTHAGCGAPGWGGMKPDCATRKRPERIGVSGVLTERG